MRVLFSITMTCFFTVLGIAQKKVLQHTDKEIWNHLSKVQISNSGDYMIFTVKKGEKDQTLHLKTTKGKTIMSSPRSSEGRFSYDSNYVVWKVNAWKDSIKEMKRRKIKKKNLPKDTLYIYHIKSRKTHRIPNVKSYTLPEKWSGIVAYTLEPKKLLSTRNKDSKRDTTTIRNSKKKKLKKVSKKNGYHLVVRNLENGLEDTLKFVHRYALSREGAFLTYATSGEEQKSMSGVYLYDVNARKSTLLFESHQKTTYPQLTIAPSGKKIGFVVDSDSTKSLIKKPSLYAWKSGNDKAELIVSSGNNASNLLVSSNEKLSFSKNEKRLFFGLRAAPIVKDTTLLDEETVNVEVWTYNEPRLYTVQKMQVQNDQKKAFRSLYDFSLNKMIQIADPEFDLVRYGDEGDSEYAIVGNTTPYMLESQWTAQRPMDIQRVDLSTGEKSIIGIKVYGRASVSPKGKYLFGYSRRDSTWFTYNLKTLKYQALTKGKIFYNELHDYPDDPRSYGFAGWTENDEEFLIYDRFDIWSFNPDTAAHENLTNGRSSKTQYRYIRVNSDERSISKHQNWILSTFNEATKYGGFASYHPEDEEIQQLITGPYLFGKLQLAQQDKKNRLLYTRQSFEEFPNLWSSNLSFKSPKQVTNINPQQNQYNWGTAEMVEWVSLDGKLLQGMLIKPENFDPNKKYPMIVNFYEKSSNRLYRHHPPTFGRSTINYSFYASRGYLIFNPDVYYRDGYPGESAFNCVIPGITALIDQGFVDKDNIGVQGHSWGGYQIAYLVTKTNIFKAAESGAPVVNMISAYGGIRWQTGLSRQFQYEHTQSRIGGTPWQYPQRYLENSPIFNIDKINTPLLIMHNDADGHVPWYQGIEFFVSLRRLGKPSWLLNYNGEPHWPLKLQNRTDFNIRMSQFFDHYLKGVPKPVWMEHGVPALEKGINQGYESILDDKR